MTDMLRCAMAPIADEAWQEIERQSARMLRGNLSARKLVDFSGPFGWSFAAVNLGRLEVANVPEGGLAWGRRKVLPLLELRVPFSLGIWELDDVVRGAKNPDLEALKTAARKAADFEETAIYRGFAQGGIQGILQMASHPPVPLGPDRGRIVEAVEQAVLAIQEGEVGGPYALVLGTAPYTWVMAGEPGAYPLRLRLEALVTGGIHWSPALEGGLVLSRRGGDFELTVGQDLAIGYKGHTHREVELFFAESFTFRVLEPGAAVGLQLQG